jgi:hypothetical protein
LAPIHPPSGRFLRSFSCSPEDARIDVGEGRGCARSFGERIKLLHFSVMSSDKSQNVFRFESPVGGLFSVIYFLFDSLNRALVRVSLEGVLDAEWMRGEEG